MQHGRATTDAEDPQRPLTRAGRDETERVAAWVATSGVRVDRVLHSGKLRALQTAEIMAHHLKPPGGVVETAGLGPNDDVTAFPRPSETDESVMVVGHLPFLARLAGLLVAGDPSVQPVRFQNSAVVSLISAAEGWSVEWMTLPDWGA